MTLRAPPLLAATLIAAITVPLAMAAALMVGSTGIGWPSEEIFWLIRLPRMLAAFGTGMALAVAGALIQLVSRNPLGDPHILGVSSGASVGALAVLMWLPAALPFATELGAVGGAVVSMTLVFALAWKSLGRNGMSSAQPGTIVVLLVGVMVGAACSAIVAFMLAIANEQQLRGLVFWLLGDLNGASLWWPVWLASIAALALAWPRARELDWMARGDAWAWSLGVPIGRRRKVAVFAACLATGAAVATAGSIGFVGLVAPHIVRLVGLRSASALLPFSALFGGVFILIADTLARTLIAPAQLPVGVISAAVGVPLFLTLLLRQRTSK